MTRRFAAATPSAQVPELLHRLREAPEPFLVVLDGQRRPMGIVCALDVLVAASESNGSRAKGSLLTAN
jgi:CBS-domain-containing membrane protein